MQAADIQTAMAIALQQALGQKANPFKGEIAVQVEGRTVVLVLNFNVMASFEASTGINALRMINGADDGKTGALELRDLVHHCMLPRQPQATVEEAGDVLSADSGVIIRLVAASTPKPEPALVGEEGNGKAARKKRPPARR